MLAKKLIVLEKGRFKDLNNFLVSSNLAETMPKFI